MTDTDTLGSVTAANVVAYVDQAIAGINTQSVDSKNISILVDKFQGLLSAQNGGSRLSAVAASNIATKNTNQIHITPIKHAETLGMDKKTGRLLTGIDHLKQSIADILHTYIGARVMRRKYGSKLFQKIDAPQNAITRIGLMADVVDALEKWEPRLSLTRVQIVATKSDQSNGKMSYQLTGHYNGAEITVGVLA